jgi:hypothetical protein
MPDRRRFFRHTSFSSFAANIQAPFFKTDFNLHSCIFDKCPRFRSISRYRSERLATSHKFAGIGSVSKPSHRHIYRQKHAVLNDDIDMYIHLHFICSYSIQHRCSVQSGRLKTCAVRAVVFYNAVTRFCKLDTAMRIDT